MRRNRILKKIASAFLTAAIIIVSPGMPAYSASSTGQPGRQVEVRLSSPGSLESNLFPSPAAALGSDLGGLEADNGTRLGLGEHLTVPNGDANANSAEALIIRRYDTTAELDESAGHPIAKVNGSPGAVRVEGDSAVLEVRPVRPELRAAAEEVQASLEGALAMDASPPKTRFGRFLNNVKAALRLMRSPTSSLESERSNADFAGPGQAPEASPDAAPREVGGTWTREMIDAGRFARWTYRRLAKNPMLARGVLAALVILPKGWVAPTERGVNTSAFISVDGNNGSGKTGNADRVKNFLEGRGHFAEVINRSPRKSLAAAMLAQAEQDGVRVPEFRALLDFLDFRRRSAEVQLWLNRGAAVIADGWTPRGLVEGVMRGMDPLGLSLLFGKLMAPGHVVYLNRPAEISLSTMLNANPALLSHAYQDITALQSRPLPSSAAEKLPFLHWFKSRLYGSLHNGHAVALDLGSRSNTAAVLENVAGHLDSLPQEKRPRTLNAALLSIRDLRRAINGRIEDARSPKSNAFSLEIMFMILDAAKGIIPNDFDAFQRIAFQTLKWARTTNVKRLAKKLIDILYRAEDGRKWQDDVNEERISKVAKINEAVARIPDWVEEIIQIQKGADPSFTVRGVRLLGSAADQTLTDRSDIDIEIEVIGGQVDHHVTHFMNELESRLRRAGREIAPLRFHIHAVTPVQEGEHAHAASQADANTNRRWKRGISSLVVGAFLGQFAMWAGTVAYGALNTAVGGSLASFGFLMSFAFVGAIAGTALAGILPNRYLRRVLKIFSFLRIIGPIVAVTVWLTGGLTWPLLCACVTLEYFAFGASENARTEFPAAVAGGRKAFMKDLMARQKVAYALGALLGPVMMILAAALASNPLMIFLLPSFVYAVMIVNDHFAPDLATQTDQASQSAPDKPGGPNARGYFSRWRAYLSNPWARGALFLTLSMALYMMKTKVPGLFTDDKDLTSLLLLAGGVGDLLGLMLYRSYLHRYSPATWIRVGILGTLLLALSFLWPNPWTIAAGLLLFTGLNAVGRQALNAEVVHQAEKEMQGPLIAMARISAYAVGAAIAALAGLALVTSPAHAWIWIAGLMLLLTAAQWFGASHLGKQDQTVDPNVPMANRSPDPINRDQDLWNNRWKKLAQNPIFEGPSDMAKHLVESGEVKRGDRVISFGPGPGLDEAYFAENGAQAVGADFSTSAVDQINHRAAHGALTLHAVQQNLRLPVDLPDGRFDVGYAHQSLMYFDDPEFLAILRAMRRILKSGAKVAISVRSREPGHEDWKWEQREEHRLRHGIPEEEVPEGWVVDFKGAKLHLYTAADLERLFAAAGFAGIKVEKKKLGRYVDQPESSVLWVEAQNP